MAGITQTIPNYIGGISEQPDLLKGPGQVKNIINGIPDVTFGLYKRPGSKRIGTNPLSSVQSGGSWFHYYRDETEGSYVGQIDSTGTVRVWRCSDGVLMNTAYGTGGEAAIKSYLTPTTPEDLQMLTINDTTFVTNRSKTVATTGTTVSRATSTGTQEHQAYLDLIRTENGRQYSLNISTPTALPDETITRATLLKIKADTLDESAGTAACPGIGTQVFAISNPFLIGGIYYHVPTTSVAHIPNRKFYAKSGDNVRKYHPKKKLTLINTIVYNDDNTGTDDMPWLGSQNASSDEGTDGDARWILSNGSVNLISAAIGTFASYNSSGNYNNNAWIDAAPLVTALQGGTGYAGLNFTITYDGLKIFLNAKNDDWSDVNGTWTLKRCNADGTLRPDQTAAEEYITGTAIVDGEYVSPHYTTITPDTTRKNLIFRLTTLGQVGQATTNATIDSYSCTYHREIDLLHGGEGWALDNQVVVEMDTPKTTYNYTIGIEDIETSTITADVKIVRPTPTPFDAETAVTVDTIIGGLLSELSGLTVGGQALNTKVIGNGIFFSCANEFNIEITEPDLMRVMQSTINDVTELPNQCKHGYIVKVANASMSDEDDYYLKFDGSNTSDGAGAWTECAAPGIVKGFDLSTMPIVIQRTAIDTFTVKQFTYPDRLTGDDTTNPIPSFVGGKINKVLFFRNRLAFLSGENVITCRPGTLGTPNFWNNTALTVSAADPIDISSSSMFPSDLYDGIEINTGLLVFSSNQQFLLSSDDAILNPDTAKLRSISTYNYNITIPPISLGTTVGFIDNSGKFSRFNEMAGIAREGEPMVNEVSKVVPSLLPKDLDLITNSRENQLILFGKTDSDIVYGLKYFRTSERQVQTAWFKWQLNNPIKYHFIIDDVYYYLDNDNFLQRINIIQSDDPSFIKDANTFNIHIDNYTTVEGGTYDIITNLTTFTGVSWLPSVTTPNGDLVLIDTNTNSIRVARYAKPTMLNTTDFTVPGDWSSASLNIGYLYEYNVELPRIYPTKVQGPTTRKDTNASLVIHRIKLNFGLVGLYETTLSRVGKDDYTEIYESAMADDYNVDDAPYVIEQERIIPVYERNINVDISVKSSHPSPTTLHSMSWEGDYSPRFYKRV